MSRYAALCAMVLALVASTASAVECRNLSYEGNRYTICEVDVSTEDLRLFLRDDQGAPYGQFSTIDRTLPDGQALSFAMNAGMYHSDRRPVGLYVEDGVAEGRLLTGASKGNFGLLPNGVFCIRETRADVIESLTFEETAPDCTHATQSGPMLVIDGALHPRFLPDSTSRHLRNGVGTSANGTRAIFAISNNAVTFHEFGSLFRDHLSTPNALYFDGKISRLHAPQLDRSDPGFWMGPIVGVVTVD
ncbi:phosphodiester glycosidase family protein [uncultured Shimia sp.]|uniref:phosphodiester glycosidase family protein n=1 Tax=uncultured Shimia sp. TaxID=573152 RepID=UPI00261BAC9F|nr:phosphodiester glycosidase family protein [uncultured Shimia sp.]